MRYPVFRPPYVYRWAVLLTSLASVIALAVVAVHAAADAGPEPAPAALAATLTPLPASTAPAAVPSDLVQRAAGAGRAVALTFDDGPHPEYTSQVLDLLTRYGAVATFCVVGAEATRHPSLVRAIADAGMTLCSHTVSHDVHLPTRTDAQLEAEILGGRDAVVAALGRGVAVPYFRAPQGNWSARVQAVAARHGMKPLSWSVDSKDWRRPGTEQIVASVKQAVQPGAVILLHDGGGRRDQTVAALAQLLPWLIAQNYTFAVPA